MNEENKSILSPTIEGERNEILRRYGNHSFSAALKEVNDTLLIEKDYLNLHMLDIKRSLE